MARVTTGGGNGAGLAALAAGGGTAVRPVVCAWLLVQAAATHAAAKMALCKADVFMLSGLAYSTENPALAVPAQLPVPLACQLWNPSGAPAILTFIGNGLAAELAKFWAGTPALSMV